MKKVEITIPQWVNEIRQDGLPRICLTRIRGVVKRDD